MIFYGKRLWWVFFFFFSFFLYLFTPYFQVTSHILTRNKRFSLTMIDCSYPDETLVSQCINIEIGFGAVI